MLNQVIFTPFSSFKPIQDLLESSVNRIASFCLQIFLIHRPTPEQLESVRVATKISSEQKKALLPKVSEILNLRKNNLFLSSSDKEKIDKITRFIFDSKGEQIRDFPIERFKNILKRDYIETNQWSRQAASLMQKAFAEMICPEVDETSTSSENVSQLTSTTKKDLGTQPLSHKQRIYIFSQLNALESFSKIDLISEIDKKNISAILEFFINPRKKRDFYLCVRKIPLNILKEKLVNFSNPNHWSKQTLPIMHKIFIDIGKSAGLSFDLQELPLLAPPSGNQTKINVVYRGHFSLKNF